MIIRHRILEFDINGDCIAEHQVKPHEGTDIFNQIKNPHENAVCAQWQALHSKYGWQGFANRYK